MMLHFIIKLGHFIAESYDEGNVTCVYDDTSTLNPEWMWDA